MNENKEIHIIKATVLIKKISISVRFPCSLSFQLKTQSKNIDNIQLYDLRKGQCILNESLSIETKAQYNTRTKKYSQCNVIATVFMTSANGKIPAGSFNVVFKNEDFVSQNEATCNLQKCPDRSAQVHFTKSALYLRQATLTQISDRRSSYSSSQVGQSSQYLGYGSRQDFTPTYQTKRSQVNKSNEQSHTKLSRSGLKTQTYQRQYKTRLRRQQNSPQQSKSSYRAPNIVKDSFKQSKVSRSSSQLSQIVMQSQQQQLHQQKSKIMKLQKEKTQYIRQVAKLKGELQLVQVSNQQIVENEVGLLKQQNFDLTQKVDQYKDKCRDLQRKQRQLQAKIKDLNAALEQKNMQSKKLVASQSILDKKDKVMKQYEIKIAKFQETIEELNSAISTQQKRQQSKQNSYKQQLKRMNQKYNQSQVERQKALFDLNKILGQFQTSETKYRMEVKQKEKNHMLQKDQFYKKITFLDQKFQELMKQQEIYKKKIEQLTSKSQHYEKELSSKEDELIKVNEELRFANSQSNRFKDLSKQLQAQLKSLRNNRNEITDYRQKYQVVNQQLVKDKAKFQALEAKCRQLQSKNKELQATIKFKSLQSVEKQKRIKQLSKDISQLKREEEKRAKQAQTLSFHNYNSSQKATQLQKRLQNEIEKNKTLQETHQNQLIFVMKQKQQLESQIEDYKWRNQENTLRNQQLIEKLQQSNKQKMEIHEENVYNIEHISKIEQAMVEMKRQIDSLKQYNKKLLQLEKQSVKTIKNYKDQILRQEQQIKSYEKNEEMIKDKLAQYEIIFKQREKQQDSFNRESDVLLSKKREEYSILQMELHSKNKKIEQLQLRMQFQNKKIYDLETQLVSESKSSEKVLDNFKKANDKVAELEQKLKKINSEKQEVDKQLKNKIKSQKKSKEQLQTFKRETNNAFRYLLNILQRDDEADINGKLYPDYDLSLMQIQALKKRHTMLTNHKRMLRQLESNNNFLKKQNETLVQRLQERQNEFDEEFRRYKDESRLLLGQNRTENEELLQKNKQLQSKVIELTSQLQKTNIECNSLKESMEELEFQFMKLGKQREQLEQQCQNLDQALSEAQNTLRKEKQRSNSQHTQLKSQISQDLNKLKAENYEMSRKLTNYDKILKQKQENISNLNSEITQLTEQNKKTSVNVSVSYGRAQQLQREKKQLQREVQKLYGQVQAYKQDQNSYKQKILLQKNNIIELHKKIQDLNQIIENERKKAERIKIENQGNQSRIEFLQKLLNQKENDDKNKNSEKVTEQFKEMQEKIIKISSELEIKEFLATQNDNKISELALTKQNLMTQLLNKKNQLQAKSKAYSEAQNQRIKMEQQVIRTQNEKVLLLEEIKNSQKRIEELEILIVDYDTIKQELSLRQRQLNKLKQQNMKNQRQLQKSMVDLRVSMVNQRKEIVSKGKEQQEQRAKIRALQQQLEDKEMDLAIEKKKWDVERQKEKQALITQCQILELANENLLAQYNSYKDQSLEDISRLNKDILELEELIANKQTSIQQLTEQRDRANAKIQELSGQLSYCIQTWNQQKQLYKQSRKSLNKLKSQMSKFQRNANRLDGVNKQLIEISKQKIKQQPNPSITDSMRQLSTGLLKCKTRILAIAKIQKEKNTILTQFKNVQEIVELALKKSH